METASFSRRAVRNSSLNACPVSGKLQRFAGKASSCDWSFIETVFNNETDRVQGPFYGEIDRVIMDSSLTITALLLSSKMRPVMIFFVRRTSPSSEIIRRNFCELLQLVTSLQVWAMMLCLTPLSLSCEFGGQNCYPINFLELVCRSTCFHQPYKED